MLNRDQVLLLAAHAADEQDAALYVTAPCSPDCAKASCSGWSDVDFLSDVIHVRHNYTDRTEKVPKGKRVRSVPMVPEVADRLAKLKSREHFTSDENLVFCSEVGAHLCSWKLRRRFYRALEEAGLPRIVFHSLRHCFGPHGIRAWDPNTLQGYMGHQHYSTTARYLHHRPAAADAAKLAAAFSGHAGDTFEIVEPPGKPKARICGRFGRGADRNRTGVHGFAGRCVATPPRRRARLHRRGGRRRGPRRAPRRGHPADQRPASRPRKIGARSETGSARFQTLTASMSPTR